MVKWSNPQDINPDTATGSESGSEVDISGNYIIVGAEDSDCVSTDAGSAFIIERKKDGSFVTKRLTQSNPDGASEFGSTVSISGNYCVVGAFTDNNECTTPTADFGSAYIFKRNKKGEWKELIKLTQPTEQLEDGFGFSVSISGCYVAVGAPSAEPDCTDCTTANFGAVFIYEIDKDDNVTLIKTLGDSDLPESLTVGANLGQSVQLSDNYLIVGAVLGDINCTNSGDAYVFERNGDGVWEKGKNLTPSILEGGGGYGSAVAISGNYCAVGGSFIDSPGSGDGIVDVFERNSVGVWNRVTTLTVPSNYDGTSVQFGNSVSLSGNYLLVGATNTDCTAANTGEVFFYSRDEGGGWTFRTALTKPDYAETQANSFFGDACAISGNFAVVGSELYDSPATDSGLAVFYQGNKD